MINKLNQIMSWISLFAMVWLMAFGILPRTSIVGAAFIFFALVAFCSGASVASREKEDKDERKRNP